MRHLCKCRQSLMESTKDLIVDMENGKKVKLMLLNCHKCGGFECLPLEDFERVMLHAAPDSKKELKEKFEIDCDVILEEMKK